jgi:hypothetical protein
MGDRSRRWTGGGRLRPKCHENPWPSGEKNAGLSHIPDARSCTSNWSEPLN